MRILRWWRVGVFALLALPVVAAAQVAYTARDVNLRAGPDQGYPLVTWLPGGTPLQVYGCVDGYAWCDVEVSGARGWIYANYINYPYQSGQVPIYAYGPQLNIPLITFSIGTYWGNYYGGRPWYSNRNYWYGYRPPPRPGYGPGYRPPYHGGGYRPPYHGGGYRPPGYRPPSHGGGYRPPPGNGNRPPPPGGGKPPGMGNGGGRPPSAGGGRPPSGGGNGGRPGGGGGGAPPQPR